MDTGVQALQRAGNRVAAVLVALCVALATAGPDLLPSRAPRQSCCRFKRACACHTEHSSREQPAWSAKPNCSKDCHQLANATRNWIGSTARSNQLTAALPHFDTAVYDGSHRFETQQNTSLHQRPPPRKA